MTVPTVQLGNTGLHVPRLMLGAEALGGHDWGDLDVSEVERACSSAIELGLTFFDVADCYGLGLAEERLGRLVKSKRDQVVIATKFGVRVSGGKTRYDTSPGYIADALEASLKRLGTDYIDLYQVHWPDGKTPLGEVFSTDKVQVRLPLNNRQLSALGLPIGFAPVAGEGFPRPRD